MYKWQEKRREEEIALDLKKLRRYINQVQLVWTLLRYQLEQINCKHGILRQTRKCEHGVAIRYCFIYLMV